MLIAADYAAPETLAEALDLMARYGEDARPLAGGQSLVILLRAGLVAPEILVDLKRIPELLGIGLDDGWLTVGATTTYRAVARDAVVREGWSILAEAAGAVGSIHIRNRGTLGGSVAQADPVGDATVALLALDGVVDVASAAGRRTVAVDDFDIGAYTTALDPSEIVTALRVPPVPAGSTSAYLRLSLREGEFPLTQAAVRLTWRDGTIADARVAAGGIGEVPARLRAAETTLVGTSADRAAIERAVEACLDGIEPLADARGGAEWRRDVAVVTLRRALGHASRQRERAA
jgi:carbon-monoxide dehydrogenase medium subunit